VTENSTIGEVMAHPTAGPLFASLAGLTTARRSDSTLGVDLARVAASMPLSRLAASGRLSRETLAGYSTLLSPPESPVSDSPTQTVLALQNARMPRSASSRP
jgi:hypothetical protein